MTPQERAERIIDDCCDLIHRGSYFGLIWEIGPDLSMALMQEAMMQAIADAVEAERERVRAQAAGCVEAEPLPDGPAPNDIRALGVDELIRATVTAIKKRIVRGMRKQWKAEDAPA